MKLKIFFITIGAPLLFTILLLWPPFDRLSIRLFLVLAIAAGLLMGLFFNRKKYLSKLVADSGGIHLEFIAAPLVTRYRRIALQDLQDIRISPDNYRYEPAGMLHLKTSGKWESYIVLNKKILTAVRESLAGAGLHVGKPGKVQTA